MSVSDLGNHAFETVGERLLFSLEFNPAVLELAVSSIIDRLPVVVDKQVRDLDLMLRELVNGVQHFLLGEPLSEGIPSTFSRQSDEPFPAVFETVFRLTEAQSIVPILHPFRLDIIQDCVRFFEPGLGLLALLGPNGISSLVHDCGVGAFEVVSNCHQNNGRSCLHAVTLSLKPSMEKVLVCFHYVFKVLTCNITPPLSS